MQKLNKNRLPSFKEGINLHQETKLIKITYQVHLRISAKIQHFNRKMLKLEIGTQMRESWVMFKSRDKIHIRSIKKAIFLKLWKKFTSLLTKRILTINRVYLEHLITKNTIKAWINDMRNRFYKTWGMHKLWIKGIFQLNLLIL
jgi:hypothetical protein